MHAASYFMPTLPIIRNENHFVLRSQLQSQIGNGLFSLRPYNAFHSLGTSLDSTTQVISFLSAQCSVLFVSDGARVTTIYSFFHLWKLITLAPWICIKHYVYSSALVFVLMVTLQKVLYEMSRLCCAWLRHWLYLCWCCLQDSPQLTQWPWSFYIPHLWGDNSECYWKQENLSQYSA